ncbi:putative thiol methyltransferase 2 [Smittium mucronatum]|uniref:Putative thiol methyltransferase 2 n=1 Tax=Smittium mucronatum TaxID=133383 RepID=A0A1R0H2W8_9FUNG|nr:putative thiol methyltransferase 2 [Smittium mucronatum]
MAEDRKEYNEFWEKKWVANETYWDIGKMQVALKELIEENKFPLPKGNCLVPGCGRGYDAIFFAQQGFKTIGLDVSVSARNAAISLAKQHDILPGLLEFVTDDFYTFEPPASLFQVAYDYTFLSIIKPKDRHLWGQRYAELISPGGYLITLIFPIDFGADDGNIPPFKLNIKMCHEALDMNFTLVYEDTDPPKDPERDSACIMAIWKRVLPLKGSSL